MDQVPSVVTVVITYNALDDTVACVESLLRADYDHQQILVVDNGSSGEAAAIRARFGDAVTTIEAGRNLGYGAGANKGIDWAVGRGADYVWVINNDTVVRPDSLRRLVEAMESDPRIGAASPQITAPEGPEAPAGIWFAGGVVDLRKGETRHLVTPIEAENVAVDSAFLTGCALLIRTETLARVGRFWERLFLYWEDTDLVLRIRRAGWRTCVVPGAWIDHAIHGTSARSVVDYYHFRNAQLVAWRHVGRRGSMRASLRLAYVVARRWASAWLRHRPAPVAESRGLLVGLATTLRWGIRAPRDVKLGRTVRGDKPLAVLHVVRRYSPLVGGTELYVHDLATAQAHEGYRVTVVTLDRDVARVDPGHFPKHEEQDGVRIVRMPGIGSARFALTGRPDILIGEIRRADVVHIHDLRFMVGLTCITARLSRRRVILHTHGLIFHTTWAAGLKRFLVKAYYGPLARVTGAVVAASSEPDRNRLLSLVPYLDRGSVVVENAIRLESLLELPRQPIPGRVLAFGRVARSKSLDRLIDAMATIVPPSWELLIAGAEEPLERSRLEVVASSAGIGVQVRFLGQYSDGQLGELLSSAMMAAFPSSGEGFGLALLEAMAGGVPVLASDIPAHRSVLGPDLTDRLVDFDDSDATGRAIKSLLALDAASGQAIVDRERNRALAFDVSRLARDVDDLYRLLGLGVRPKRV